MSVNGLSEQLGRIGTAAREVVASGWSTTQRAGQAALDRASEATERALDAVFDERYDVPDADAARQMIIDASAKRTSVVWTVIEGFAFARLARLIARFSRFNVSAAVITAAPTAVSGIRHAIAGGLVQLRVLASFLSSRARADGVALDKALIRAVTVEVYLHPRDDLRFRYTRGGAGRAVATHWARDAASGGNERTQRKLADERVAAIDRLDLRALDHQWRANEIEAVNPG
jgi:hypothetical protein